MIISGSTSDDDVFLGASELRSESVTVFCVGAGPFYEMDQLKGIATKPSERHIVTVKTFDVLSDVEGTLAKKIEEGMLSLQRR